MSSRDASKMSPPSNLVAFPSLSSSLNSLPNATNLQNLRLHPSMYAQRDAESTAKLQKALAHGSTAPSASVSLSTQQPPSQAQGAPLMMRKKT